MQNLFIYQAIFRIACYLHISKIKGGNRRRTKRRCPGGCACRSAAVIGRFRDWPRQEVELHTPTGKTQSRRAFQKASFRKKNTTRTFLKLFFRAFHCYSKTRALEHKKRERERNRRNKRFKERNKREL